MKTAMQELLSEMSHPNWNRLSFDARYEMFDTLLEKEKEQIIKAYKDHHDLGHIFGLDTEQYFNQTYNQNK
jgi:hypothetical protein